MISPPKKAIVSIVDSSTLSDLLKLCLDTFGLANQINDISYALISRLNIGENTAEKLRYKGNETRELYSLKVDSNDSYSFEIISEDESVSAYAPIFSRLMSLKPQSASVKCFNYCTLPLPLPPHLCTHSKSCA